MDNDLIPYKYAFAVVLFAAFAWFSVFYTVAHFIGYVYHVITSL